MFQFGRYTFKRAETAAEFEQIHALNYSTFVREIRSTKIPATDGSWTSSIQNLYFVALPCRPDRGMVCAHDQPPFSVAGRLPDPGILEAADVVLWKYACLAIEAPRASGGCAGGVVLGCLSIRS